jgi:hypothetical protein
MTTETPDPTYDYATAKRRADFIDGLRKMADFFEQHPQIKTCSIDGNVFVERSELAALARLGGGSKEYYDSWFALRRTFGEDVRLDINVSREQVCRKVVVGHKIVPAQPEREVEIVDWVCEESVLLDPRRI